MRDRHPMRQTQFDARPPMRRRVVIGILVACVVLLSIGSKIKPVAGAFSPVYVPVESTLSTVSSSVGTFVDSIIRAPSLASRNKALTKEVAKLTIDVAQLPLYKREILALDRELHFNDLNTHLEVVRAQRFSLSQVGLSSSFQVGVGSNSHVRINDPVLDENGYVIGKVLEVTPAASTVGLLNDYQVNVPAMDAETHAQGLVQYRDGSVTLSDVEAGNSIRTGDYVVTSAIGNEYPTGELIGRISALHGQTVQSLNSATISTAANLDSVNDVQIITRFGPGASVRYQRGSHRP